MLTTLLFDADGVLINGAKFSDALEKVYGISPVKTADFFTNEFPKCLIGEADLKEELSKHLKTWGWKKSVDELLQFWFQTEHHIDVQLVDYIQTLRSQGLHCYVATNQEKYRVDYMLEKMGFKDAFDGIFASAHLGHKKPAQEFFAQLLENLNIQNKNEVLFWDDMPVNVDAAHEFGIHAEVYESFKKFEEKMKKYLQE